MAYFSLNEEEWKVFCLLMKKMYCNIDFTENEVVLVLDKAQLAFQDEGTLLEIDAPVSICGDIHGQYYDLLRLFNAIGWPPERRYLFLGDYVDRGDNSIEVILLLLLLKILYPGSVFLLRGNHETLAVNRGYGFLEEVRHRYSRDIYIKFNHLFNFMPVAGLISGKIFCMHGGLSKDLESFDQIRSIERPVEIPLQGLLADLLWSDPDRNIKGWEISARNVGYVFGEDVILEFCERMNIDLIVRAHQVVDFGYEFFADSHLVTIFSAPNYCRQFTNLAGVLQVDSNLCCKIFQLKPK
ncbi:Serine/threonine-protein phosphatase PP1-alpha catalytic subunit [Trichinella zimbabwensis]|uniref:Serine/threonine-protein phosphatase n=1 Tax=Trichinella zimbabwensis TaxID=268475 RepID=A0A0V1I7E1_9BILA|nr:Serine/threonine-protein phosphatase PP1-alpha catalytic subunit [Trichinella zimbabwensis]